MAMVISGWARFIRGINHRGEGCFVPELAQGQRHKKVPKKKARQGKKHVKDLLWKVPCGYMQTLPSSSLSGAWGLADLLI